MIRRMDLILFDLDGTLLNKRSEITVFTRDTLRKLSELNIAYTVATGRTLHTARDLLEGHEFRLPHIFKNGVMIWDPNSDQYLLQNYLSLDEIRRVLEAMLEHQLTPFVFTLEPGNRHGVYHTALCNETEVRLAKHFGASDAVTVLPIDQLPAEADITNISSLGAPGTVAIVEELVLSEPHLVAYAGSALEGAQYRWVDIHHSDASKGAAMASLKAHVGASRVICFGDSDNDLSMFAAADESYATANANTAIKEAATAVIGHHDEDGVARYLRERYW
ncbi:MAG: hydroxymethylpyrimidine pyrophosphatase-like HAD family hydrolase [Halieaceae bacterium]|jgi:hydroxymethylpyrimidine pyrophosphatase-like HAD family hydrolase